MMTEKPFGDGSDIDAFIQGGRDQEQEAQPSKPENKQSAEEKPQENKHGKVKEPMVRVSLDLPKSLHRVVRKDAFDRETTIMQIVRELVVEKYNWSAGKPGK